MMYFVRTILFIAMMFVSVVAYAVEPLPKFLQGDFYDSYHLKHNLIMRNTPYTFFGKEVVFHKLAYELLQDIEWVITVKTNEGYDTYRVRYCYGGITVAQTSTGTIWVAHNEAIHSYKPKDAIEGIAPYMTRAEVIARYGEPHKKEGGYSYDPNPNSYIPFYVKGYEEWTYSDGPWTLKLKNGQVSEIKIPAHSTKQFDNCRLGTDASYQDFYSVPGFQKHKYYDAVRLNEPQNLDIGFWGTEIVLVKGRYDDRGYIIPGSQNSNGGRSNIIFQVNTGQ